MYIYQFQRFIQQIDQPVGMNRIYENLNCSSERDLLSKNKKRFGFKVNSQLTVP